MASPSSVKTYFSEALFDLLRCCGFLSLRLPWSSAISATIKAKERRRERDRERKERKKARAEEGGDHCFFFPRGVMMMCVIRVFFFSSQRYY